MGYLWYTSLMTTIFHMLTLHTYIHTNIYKHIHTHTSHIHTHVCCCMCTYTYVCVMYDRSFTLLAISWRIHSCIILCIIVVLAIYMTTECVKHMCVYVYSRQI